MWPLDDDDDDEKTALRNQKWWMKVLAILWGLVTATWLALAAIAYIFKVNFVADEHFIHWPVDRNQLRIMCDLDDEQFSDFPPKRKIVLSNKLLLAKIDAYMADELRYQELDKITSEKILKRAMSPHKALKEGRSYEETNKAIEVVKRVRARLIEFSKEVEGKKNEQ